MDADIPHTIPLTQMIHMTFSPTARVPFFTTPRQT